MSETGASGAIDSRMDIHQILEYLPHRYPILLVDRVLEVVPGERITALKNVSMNEPFFPGPLPASSGDAGRAGGRGDGADGGDTLLQDHGRQARRRVGVLLRRHRQCALQEAGRARRPADHRCPIETTKRGIWKYSATAKVDGQVAAEADLMCAMRSTSA
jgi:3-hydroxyacyl-[acyl-carrier-protein] dehydratase